MSAARHDLDIRRRIEALYHGRSRRARHFRYGLLAVDLAVIAFFVATSFVPLEPWVIAVDLALAVPVALDFLARLAIAPDRRRHLLSPTAIADLLVIGSLILPAFLENFAFLRVLRVLRLLRSYHVMRDLRHDYPVVRRNESTIRAAINLFVFIFLVAAIVLLAEGPTNPDIRTFVDALYFTVTTLTTTGFGDITLQGTGGRLLAIAIMVLGIGLFLRLLQTLFRPAKVHHRCPDCGLSRHDPDAVHCKHCGRVLNIESEGEGGGQAFP